MRLQHAAFLVVLSLARTDASAQTAHPCDSQQNVTGAATAGHPLTAFFCVRATDVIDGAIVYFDTVARDVGPLTPAYPGTSLNGQRWVSVPVSVLPAGTYTVTVATYTADAVTGARRFSQPSTSFFLQVLGPPISAPLSTPDRLLIVDR